MRQAGADPGLEQQQGKSRAHRISQSVLQQIANLKQQKQQNQDPAAQTSSSAGTGTGAADSAAAKQQEQQEGGKVEVQSTQQPSDAESKSVAIAAVDDMDYLLTTSHDETGSHTSHSKGLVVVGCVIATSNAWGKGSAGVYHSQQQCVKLIGLIKASAAASEFAEWAMLRWLGCLAGGLAAGINA
jgi:hypothetical protein